MIDRDQTTPDKHQSSSGSPDSSEPVFLVAGRLHKPHGVKGEIELEVVTDFPQRLQKGSTLYIGDEHQPVLVTSRRGKGDLLLLSFEGFETREAVSRLRNQWVYTQAKELPALPAGEYYHHQLIGLRVTDAAGTELGTLKEILETGANDVYVIQNAAGQETLLPAVEGVIEGVDLDQGVMVVIPPTWD